MANHLTRFNEIDNDDDMSGSSIDRNEHYDQYSTMNSPLPLLIDTNNNTNELMNKNHPNSTSTTEPVKIGFKIVLKRQSGNNYQVTNQFTSSILQPTSSSSSSSTSSTSMTPALSSSSSSSSGNRPKRAASRKVKFRFSDNESGNEHDDGSPVRKKSKIAHVINYDILMNTNTITQNNNVQQIKKRQPKIQKHLPIYQQQQQASHNFTIINNTIFQFNFFYFQNISIKIRW